MIGRRIDVLRLGDGLDLGVVVGIRGVDEGEVWEVWRGLGCVTGFGGGEGGGFDLLKGFVGETTGGGLEDGFFDFVGFAFETVHEFIVFLAREADSVVDFVVGFRGFVRHGWFVELGFEIRDTSAVGTNEVWPVRTVDDDSYAFVMPGVGTWSDE